MQRRTEQLSVLELKCKEYNDKEIQNNRKHGSEMQEIKEENIKYTIVLSEKERLQTALDTAVDKVGQLENALAVQIREESTKLDTARIEAREEQASRLTDAEVRCAKLEGEIIRTKSEQDERMNQVLQKVRNETKNKYEKLVEEKLNELQVVHTQSLQSHEQARKTEDTLRQQVGDRLKEIAEDHIPIGQHSALLRTKIDGLVAEHTREMEYLTVENDRDCDTKLEEQHYQLRAEFNVKEAELKRIIVERETDVKEAQRARDGAVDDASEERKVMLSIKEQLLEEQSIRETMQSHLKEASMNLTRLKTIVTNERDKRLRSESSLKEMQDRRYDEEKTMKRELLHKQEQNQTDVQVLVNVKHENLRLQHHVDELQIKCDSKAREIQTSHSQLSEIEATVVALNKKLKNIQDIKDDGDISFQRKDKELIEISSQLVKATARAHASDDKYATSVQRWQEERSTDLDQHQQAMIENQQKYRSCHLQLIQKTDELDAMQDRLNSSKILGKEREAALVQQLQTYRKTSNDTTTSAEHAYSLQVEHLEHQLKDNHKAQELLQEENDAMSLRHRTAKSQIQQLTEDQTLGTQRLDNVNAINRETVDKLSQLRKEHLTLAEELNAVHVENKKLNANFTQTKNQVDALHLKNQNHQQTIEILESTQKKQTNQFQTEVQALEIEKQQFVKEQVAMQFKIQQLTSEVEMDEQQLKNNNADHETDVQRTMEEMEARFVLSETELRQVCEKKSMELVQALQKITTLERSGASNALGGGGGGGGRVEELHEIQVLRDQIVHLEHEKNVYQEGKRELLNELVLSRARILENL